MTLAQTMQQYGTKLKQATWCFLLKNDEVLLALKKRGFGANLWNAVGGKVKDWETPEQAVVRETEEELTVKVSNLTQVAKINFYVPSKPEWNQQVIGFTTHDWTGIPTETEEMRPQWFNINDIPYAQMWQSDPMFWPQILAGNKIEGEFLFDDNSNVLEHAVRTI